MSESDNTSTTSKAESTNSGQSGQGGNAKPAKGRGKSNGNGNSNGNGDKKFFEGHPVVFPVSAGLIILFVIVSAIWPGRSMMLFNDIQASIAVNFSWLYIASMTGFLVFSVYLIISPYGKIKLGADDEKPDFPTLTWFAMLFSAGMGIGMLFWGVAEPMYHYLYPPSGRGAATLDSARQAMGITLFHWCLHPWSLYALVALALAYFGFRRKLPLSFRSVFYPFLGKLIHGRIGDVIDVVAVLATLFGLATSLGLGAKQVNAGLSFVFGLEQSSMIQIVIIALITCAAVASLVSGLDVGIRRLSEFNMGIAAFLLLFLFVAGPTIFLLNSVVENAGTYIRTLPTNSFWTATFEADERASWFSSWTVFYWGWWIAWSPFVGMFIARISRGRTIREFITGTLLVPTAVAIVWMTGFGGSALHQEIYADIEDDPGAISPDLYNYEPQPYPVQMTDEVHGLPMTEDRKYLVASGIRDQVLATSETNDEGEPMLVAADGTPLATKSGVLVNAETEAPYYATAATQFNETYAWEEKELTLSGYMGNSVLDAEHDSTVDTTATAMFVMFGAYPLTTLTALLGTLSIILFFITSSDSASMVADIIASGGNEDPPVGTRLFWGILEGCLAAVLLVAGGLEALQTGSITIGLPFCLLIIAMCVSLYVGLERERQGLVKIPGSGGKSSPATEQAEPTGNGDGQTNEDQTEGDEEQDKQPAAVG